MISMNIEQLLIICLIICSIIILVGCLSNQARQETLYQNSSLTSISSPSPKLNFEIQNKTQPPTKKDDFAGKYTLWDIYAHDTSDSCWVYAGDKIFDVTSYFNKHPGNPFEILSKCASNVTESFSNLTGPGGVPLLQYLELYHYKGQLIEGDKKLHPNE
ncbi:MAG: cytochrome b5 domain-containing protein [Candidatus Anstonellales archaeon]